MRRGRAAAYHHLYDRRAWRARRLDQLSRNPLCRFCHASGLIVPATIADHIVPHRGDLDLFFSGELQSLCKPCHDGAKQREERGGWDSATDDRGYPIDPKHPTNIFSQKRQGADGLD